MCDLSHNFLPFFMLLTTTRLTLREVTLMDIPVIHALLSLPETDRFNTLGIPESLEATAEIVMGWLEDKNETDHSYTFCMELNDSNQFVGLIALNLGKHTFKKGEVWVKIHSNYWNKGYTTEAMLALLKFAFTELKLHRVEAGCAVGNIASKRVLEKAGMIQEGLFRANLPIRGEWIDNLKFAILDSDFEKQAQQDVMNASNNYQ